MTIPPGTAMTVRPAHRWDISRLVEIRGAVRENGLSDPASIGAADYLPFVDDGRCWVVEADGGAVAGFAALDAAAASVWALFVAPEAEGRGAGRSLLGALVGEARQRGLGRLELETEPGSRAVGFYRAAGWSAAGPGANGSVRMTLALCTTQ